MEKPRFCEYRHCERRREGIALFGSPRKKFCDTECQWREQAERRKDENAATGRSRGSRKAAQFVGLVGDLKAEGTGKECPYCDKPLPEGQTVTCGDPECSRDYDRDVAGFRRSALRLARQSERQRCIEVVRLAQADWPGAPMLFQDLLRRLEGLGDVGSRFLSGRKTLLPQHLLCNQVQKEFDKGEEED